MWIWWAWTAYDQSWVTPLTPANAWNQTVLPSLTAAQNFAHAHGKPIAVTEWGTAIRADGHGLGDDPLYVTNMIAWMRDPVHNVVFETYFDYDGQGTNSVITGGRFPHSLIAFRTSFKRTHVGTRLPGESAPSGSSWRGPSSSRAAWACTGDDDVYDAVDGWSRLRSGSTRRHRTRREFRVREWAEQSHR